ncbi:MAG: GLUG motif-containing protein, partial [Planctomycetota bacterium]
MNTNLKTVLFLAGLLLIISAACASAHTDVTAEEAKELIDTTQEMTIVDVREPHEYNSTRGHIPGALNYPWYSGVLQADYEELPMDAPVLVVCGSGGRSNRAAKFLDSMDFSMVYDMLGGMSAWIWETETDVDPDSNYGGGTGEPNDPYLILTAGQLNAIGAEPNDWDKHFKLMANIDLSDYSYDRAVIAPDTNDAEMLFQGTPFTGVFDGNGYAISNLTCTSKDAERIGLFGYVDDENAQVKDLGLIDPNVDARINVGSLAGQINRGTITNCYIQGGSVTGNDCVGGLVGYNLGTITNCYVNANVMGGDHIGGLVGYNREYSRISDCYSKGRISGREYVGGLVGINRGIITNCYTINSVSGDKIVGGFTGSNGWPPLPKSRPYPPGDITNCYSAGSVSGNNHVGGLVGKEGYGDVTASFWDIETSGLSTSEGGTGKTTAEMQTAVTFLEAGWDFTGETNNGDEDIWSICEGTNYPRFVWQIPVGDFICPDGITMDDFFFLLEFWLNDNCDSSNDFCHGTDLDQSGTVDEDD